MLKYMVRCDMEGVSGVVSKAQTEPGASDYEYGLRMFHSDLTACIEGLHAGGAEDVVIYDEHYNGRNIDVGTLHGNVSVICGKPPYREDWAGGLDSSYAGLVLLGFHSKFGTPGGLLAHTYEPDIRDILLNGVSVGEIGMEAAIAGDYNVPLVLVTADSSGNAETQSLIPSVITVTVKESLDATGGRCFPLESTAAAIRDSASRVVKQPPDVAPFRANDPVELVVSLDNGPYLSAVRRLYPKSIVDENSVVLKGKTATSVWAQYWTMKLDSLSLVAKKAN